MIVISSYKSGCVLLHASQFFHAIDPTQMPHSVVFDLGLQCMLTSFCPITLVRLSLLTMINPNQLCDVLSFVCSKMADETNLSSKLPVADTTREV